MTETKTKTKAAKPPKDWNAAEGIEWGADSLHVGTRTYPDGTTRELTASSADEFAATAEQTDAEVARIHAARHAGVTEQIRELQAQIEVLKAQAEQYEWAV